MFDQLFQKVKTASFNFLEEFKQFSMRGNALHIAIGVIIGNAFSKIVSSFVRDIAMPPLSFLLSFITFTDLKITLLGSVYDTKGYLVRSPVELQLGNFLQSIIDFLIVALCVFIAIKAINALAMRIENKQLIDDKFEGDKDDKKIALLLQIRDSLVKDRNVDL